jgi:hypothetical protein
MLSKLKPKHLMMIGVLAMLIGIAFYALWNVVDMPRVWKHVSIVRWAAKTLGRYGISSIYFFGGVLVFLRAYAAMRSNERSQKQLLEFQQQQMQYQARQQQQNREGMNQ